MSDPASVHLGFTCRGRDISGPARPTSRNDKLKPQCAAEPLDGSQHSSQTTGKELVEACPGLRADLPGGRPSHGAGLAPGEPQQQDSGEGASACQVPRGANSKQGPVLAHGGSLKPPPAVPPDSGQAPVTGCRCPLARGASIGAARPARGVLETPLVTPQLHPATQQGHLTPGPSQNGYRRKGTPSPDVVRDRLPHTSSRLGPQPRREKQTLRLWPGAALSWPLTSWTVSCSGYRSTSSQTAGTRLASSAHPLGLAGAGTGGLGSRREAGPPRALLAHSPRGQRCPSPAHPRPQRTRWRPQGGGQRPAWEGGPAWIRMLGSPHQKHPHRGGQSGPAREPASSEG